MPRRLPFLMLTVACAGLTASCSNTDNFSILGYSTGTQFAKEIRTVRVPIFQNKTFIRGIEFQLTEAVIKEIESRTPWKVVQHGSADSELLGTVIAVPKHVISRTLLDEVREAEITLGVALVWRHGGTGQPICAAVDESAGVALQDLCGTAKAPSLPTHPILVQRSAAFIPELGESMATAKKEAVDDLARQIVSMMETPW